MQKCLVNDIIKGQANTLKKSIWASAQAGNEEWSLYVYIQATEVTCVNSKFIHKLSVKLTLDLHIIKKWICTPSK